MLVLEYILIHLYINNSEIKIYIIYIYIYNSENKLYIIYILNIYIQ